MKNSRKVSPAAGIMLVIILCCCSFFAVTFADGATSPKSAPSKAPLKSVPQSLPLLVDVGADKCIPCIKMAPILEELRKEYEGALNVKFVDVWKKPEEAKTYRIMGIPTQIFYDASGKELRRHFGFMSKEDILQTFEDLGVTLKKPAKK